MKRLFSPHWRSSAQPRKQRKYRYHAPLHLRHKFLSAALSKELRKKYGKRSLPLRKGDEVLVMRGRFRKKKAKVIALDLARSKAVLEGIQHTKRDGAKVPAPLHPRALQIQALMLEDKERIAALERGRKSVATKRAAVKSTITSQPSPEN